MKNMLSVMPYTSVGKVGFIWMSKLQKHMKGEPQPEVDKPKIKIQIAHNSTILIEGMCYFYILNFIE